MDCISSLNFEHIKNTSFASVFESLLADISSIIESVECIQAEQENFVELGCYLYRVFPAIMELQFSENPPKNIKVIVQSLSMNVNLAKDLVGECHKENYPVSDAELVKIIAELVRAIKDIGECLCLIPSTTFGGQKYVETAVWSLSDELQNVHFEFKQPIESQMSYAMQIPSSQMLPLQEESDLYPVDEEVSVPTESSQVLSMPCPVDFIKSTNQRSQRQHENVDKSLVTLPHVAHYIEPLYNTFFCPLTKQVMDDPVTIENGVTYELKVITEWFETFSHQDNIVCPTTGMKLKSRVLSANVALKTTIEEWKERNEVARIKVARTALSLACSDSMILEAIRDLQHICKRRRNNKVLVVSVGILPLLIRLLGYKDRDVRCEVLELLRQLTEEDDEGKEMIANIMDISAMIELIPPTGAILMLIRVKFNHHVDSFAAEKADKILKNLERFPDNVKQMAENGFLDPLLNHLTEGSEEVQMEMTSYLGELILSNDSKAYVAEKASTSIIKMVQSGNTIFRNAAFKALSQISSHHPNGKILVEVGILNIMAEMMFTRRIYDELMDSKKRVLQYLQIIKVNTHGRRLSSNYAVYNIIHMLKNSTPDELNINLIRILLCLTKSPRSMDTIVSVVNETEASYTLIELINNPHEQVGVAVIKLLILLVPHGQPQSLMECPSGTNHITEKQALSARFLAKLPQQNLTLNLALLNNNVVPTILERIFLIQRNGTRTSRHATVYLEGLVGILVRFTATLYEPQMLFLARTHNLTSVFTEMLIKTSSDEVQILSAIGLENLSLESINLSRPPQIKKTGSKKLFRLPNLLSSWSVETRKIPVLCPVHRGACSSETTFCLIDAKAVERLLVCLDHENDEVVEASMAAICTLLDDKVDVDTSVSLLSENNAIQYVLKVVKEHRQEGLWQKSFWMIEKFLVRGGNKSVSDISQDRLLPASLISAFHNGNDSMK
ncbi:hypothetical protein ES319_D12G179600v1 [Gossypium barbadense]|uniref:RING-type E3 ubiquitin transferase n=2 Tax=Gossypium TaxID=3633 RepID=A0A5J5P218_GOSBA|nr:hypothetical protein ES319_D12G179600v1 [Gossypium barbadense]TYG41613.1 hypothetical protein ES288_D12G189600v1 [Gossypium darwinii]